MLQWPRNWPDLPTLAPGSRQHSKVRREWLHNQLPTSRMCSCSALNCAGSS